MLQNPFMKHTLSDKYNSPFTTQSQLLTTQRNNPFKNLLGKGENAGNQHFLLFPTIFSTPTETNFNFRVMFILLSANLFNLDKSKISLFGKELKKKNYFE